MSFLRWPRLSMPEPLAAEAFAKVNLGLIVRSRGGDGYHPLLSLAQSISWSDRLEVRSAEDDEFTASGMDADESNLAWRALRTVRGLTSARFPLALHLDKHIPIAAGLGGGSADAAASLALTARMVGYSGDLLGPAAELGSDIPFCLSGGFMVLEGRGDVLRPLNPTGGYALGLVVPPVELATPAVYARWDEMGEPEAGAFPEAALPPALREFVPLRNDLAPAAEALEPLVAEWRAELSGRWGRPVAMTGSGPTLFAYFLDEDEARSAIEDRPADARAAFAAVPVSRGWRRLPGTLTDPE